MADLKLIPESAESNRRISNAKTASRSEFVRQLPEIMP